MKKTHVFVSHKNYDSQPGGNPGSTRGQPGLPSCKKLLNKHFSHNKSNLMKVIVGLPLLKFTFEGLKDSLPAHNEFTQTVHVTDFTRCHDQNTDIIARVDHGLPPGCDLKLCQNF